MTISHSCSYYFNLFLLDLLSADYIDIPFPASRVLFIPHSFPQCLTSCPSYQESVTLPRAIFLLSRDPSVFPKVCQLLLQIYRTDYSSSCLISSSTSFSSLLSVGPAEVTSRPLRIKSFIISSCCLAAFRCLYIL